MISFTATVTCLIILLLLEEQCRKCRASDRKMPTSQIVLTYSPTTQVKEIQNEDIGLEEKPGLANSWNSTVVSPHTAPIFLSSWMGDTQHEKHGQSIEQHLIGRRATIAPWKIIDNVFSEAQQEEFDRSQPYTLNSVTPPSGCVGVISEAEYEALQDLYVATKGSSWNWHNDISGQTQWVFPSNLSAPCTNSWEGIYCAPYAGMADETSLGADCNIASLILPHANLQGQLPTSIANLLQLQILNLAYNSLRGTIPPSLSNLTSLTVLRLSTSSLTGFIPSSLGSLANLTSFELGANALFGTIPSSLGDLTKLTSLELFSNYLSGMIPTSLGNLTAITEMLLDSNSLEGPIPASLGNLTALTVLALYDNSLTGPIPSCLSSLAKLTLLLLDLNFLTGSIPPSLGELTSLTQLLLSTNSLKGIIPSSLGDLRALTILELDSNLLTGPIPSFLGDLTALDTLYLNSNSLTGSIPSSLGLLSRLALIGLSSNAITGTVPSSLGLLERCIYFNISSNSLTGPIPIELGNLGSNLSASDSVFEAGLTVDLSQNALSGDIPPLLFSQQMQTVLLYSNCMRGSLPPEICASSNLQTLVLDKVTSGSSCQRHVPGFQGIFAATTLQGSIPDCVWTMPRLKTLHFSGNGLHGTIGGVSVNSALINVDVSNNFLTGSIPESLQIQPSLQQLTLAKNKLTGTLSPSFVVGENLTLLTLDVNRLSGEIPDSFASTPNIKNFSVLTGNLFSCGSSPPAADPASASYVCGSETLNDGLSACGCALVVFLSIAAVATLYRNQQAGCGSLCPCLEHLLHQGFDFMEQYTHAISKAEGFHRFVRVMEILRVWLCRLGVFNAIMCTPVYAILKSMASVGTLSDPYTWVTTSAFQHGTASAAVSALFVLFSGVFLALITQRLDILLKHTATHSVDNQSSSLSSASMNLNWKFLIQRILLQSGSLSVVLLVNVLYVYGLVFGGLEVWEQVLLEAALGLFKVLWQQQFVTFAISWVEAHHDDISQGGLIFHQVMMNVISFVVAPCLATLGTDSNCLYTALLGSPAVSSTFTITIFNPACLTLDTIGTHTYCVETPFQQPISISIIPPWFYSYECTSALLTNYIPVLLLTFVNSAVVVPLLLAILLAVPEELEPRMPLLTRLRQQSPPLTCRKLVADLLLDLTLLMTFGMAAPLLGLMVVVKQFTTTMVTRLSIGRYLKQDAKRGSASNTLAELEDAAQRFRGGETRALLGFLLSVVGLFWGAMIFDMVADLYGNTAGGIAWAVAFAVWTTVAAVAYTTKVVDDIAGSLCRLFARTPRTNPASSAYSSQFSGLDENKLHQPLTQNSLFASDGDWSSGQDAGGCDSERSHGDLLSFNSTFGGEHVTGRDSELEMGGGGSRGLRHSPG